MATDKTDTLIKDPVCGMAVDSATAKQRRAHGGQTYYFCSQHCAERFEAAPEKFLQASAARNRNGGHVARYACATCAARRLAAVDRIAARYSGSALGRMALFPARLEFGRQSFNQHVYPHRAGNGGRLRLQRRGDPGPRDFSSIVPRDGWNASCVLRGCRRNYDAGPAGSSTGTAGPPPHWSCNSGIVGPDAEDGAYPARRH